MSVKVLVTGAKGQLAKTVAELFTINEDAIDFTFVSKAELDITKRVDVQEFFGSHKFNYCINCAAYTNVEQAEQTPEIAFKVNAEGVKNIAEACKITETILIHISTDYVFDGEKNTPYTIDDIPNPINEYGKSKLLGEQHIQEILKQHFIIRTSWLYSKKYGQNFYKTIMKKVEIGETFFVTDEEIGCPTNTVNLAKYIFKTIVKKTNSYGLKHFCGSESMTWYKFAQIILIDNNFSNELNLVEAKKYLTFAPRPKNSVLVTK